MAFGAEIATAFVRIRPNMTGFKSETEAGVKSSFGELAKIAGVALGGAAAFEFGKEAISGAAQLQKSIETINAEFGQASAKVKVFGEEGAKALGISAGLADATSARFGILFQNLGIGQTQAAGMTVGLEKLAGSLSAIRGVDPAAVLDRLPLALAGNVRGLKQLGLGIDATQIKFAALKLGLISTTKDAITPAIKAQAIYALATANLPKYLDQAKAHAGDLANVQRRLSAEWSNAKDALGKALLPEITKAVTALEHWLDRMQRSGRLQQDFNTVARVSGAIVKTIIDAFKLWAAAFDTLSHAVGGAKSVLIGLFAILAIQKIRSIASAIVTDLIANGFTRLQIATEAEKAAYLESFGAMEIATIGLGATIKTALITTGIGALVVAAGLAAGYIITHWNKVKKWMQDFAGWFQTAWRDAVDVVKGIFYGWVAAVIGYLKTLADVAAKALGWLPGIGGKLKSAAHSIDAFYTDFKNKSIAAFSDIGSSSAQAYSTAFQHTMTANEASLVASLGIGTGSSAQETRDSPRNSAAKTGQDVGKVYGRSFTDAVATTVTTNTHHITAAIAKVSQAGIDQMNQRVAASVIAAKKNLDTIGQKVADEIDKIMAKTGRSLGGDNAPVTLAYKKLLGLLKGGAGTIDITRAAAQLQSSIDAQGGAKTTTNRQQVLRDQFHELTKGFNDGKLSVSQFNRDVVALLKKDGVSYKQAGKLLGSAFTDGFRQDVAALGEQAAAIAAVPAKFRNRGSAAGDQTIKIVRPLQVLQTEQARIAKQAHAQRERQIKAEEKTAKAAAKTAANTAILGKLNLNSEFAKPNADAKKNAKAAKNNHGG